MEQNEVKQLDKKKIAIIVIAIVATVLAILAGVYVYVANHFTGHFHMGTKIGNVDVSGMTAEECIRNIPHRPARIETVARITGTF